MSTTTASQFGTLLRHWRETRRYSQLDLALNADISSKHVSFLENGRNQPSRAMILRLATAMDLPLRDRNLLLSAAGFASVYTESSLEAPEFGQVDEALRRILDKHEPYPAIVVDGNWDIVAQNRGAATLMTLFIPHAAELSGNAFEILFSEHGLQPFVVEWGKSQRNAVVAPVPGGNVIAREPAQTCALRAHCGDAEHASELARTCKQPPVRAHHRSRAAQGQTGVPILHHGDNVWDAAGRDAAGTAHRVLLPVRRRNSRTVRLVEQRPTLGCSARFG